MDNVPHAKLVKGIWFPEHDEHLSGMVAEHSKVGEVVLGDGRTVGTYQKHKLDYAMKMLAANRRRVAVDVGGHVGMWSMHLADLFREVHAFEPLPDHWRLFKINLNNNPRVHLHPLGLGAKKGEVKLVVDPRNTGNTHELGRDEDDIEGVAKKERDRLGLPEEASSVHVETVKVETLDSRKLDRVDFIKIDVEGSELDVVKGARQTLLRCRPMVIVEQKGNDAKFHGGSANAAGQYLQNMGMILRKNYGGDWIMDWPGR